MVIIPSTYQECLEFLQASDLTLLGGGTDLMVKKRNWSGLAPKFEKNVLCVFHLEELQYIHEDDDGLHIGSMTRLEDMLKHPLVNDVLKTAIIDMASPAIRHVGTIGGNIGNASPAGDTLPILYVFDTLIVLESLSGLRQIPIEEYIVGPGTTIKQSNEIIKEIIIKKIDYKKFYYEKVGGRRSDAISKLSFVGLYKRDKTNKVIDIRLAFGAVFKTVVRNRDLELKLIKAINHEEVRHDPNNLLSHMVSIISDHSISEIVKEYEKIILPIDDQRSSAKYRKSCAINLLKSFLNMMGGD